LRNAAALALLLFFPFLANSIRTAQNPPTSPTTLVYVGPDGAAGTIRLVCDGAFQFARAEEADTSRVVVDLPGVRNGLKGAVDYRSDLVKKISVISLPSKDPGGTRVVFDLVHPCPVSFLPAKDSLAVVLGKKEPAGELPTGSDPAPPAALPKGDPGPQGPPVTARSAAGDAVAGTAAPPSLGGPVQRIPSDYVIGKEDLLEIGVFEQPDLTRTVRVSGDGTISVPLLGSVPLAGLSTKEAEAKLRDLLADRYLTDPQVWVFVKEAKSKKISVVGAVEKPGTFEMLGNRTLLEAISEAGGLNHQAGRDLYVLRPDPSGAATRIDIDLDDLMINGNPVLNISLAPGDVINIPIDRLLHVYVDGAVRKPGEVEYKSSRPLNLLQAIAAAGGLSERASQKGIVVIRTRTGGSQEMIKVDLKAVRKGKQENFELENGDSIYVPETFF
jgi:polysaccharide export outer membrane protein